MPRNGTIGERTGVGTGGIVLRAAGRGCVIANPPQALLRLLVTRRTIAAVRVAQTPAERLADELASRIEVAATVTEPILVPATTIPVNLYGQFDNRTVYVDGGMVPVVIGWFARRGVPSRSATACPRCRLRRRPPPGRLGFPTPPCWRPSGPACGTGPVRRRALTRLTYSPNSARVAGSEGGAGRRTAGGGAAGGPAPGRGRRTGPGGLR